MKRYASETPVEGGYYLNTTSWAIETVDGEEGMLPGAPGTASVRLMTPVMVVAALTLSFLFDIFLPLIGFALFARAVAAAGLARATRALTPPARRQGQRAGEASVTQWQSPWKGNASDSFIALTPRAPFHAG